MSWDDFMMLNCIPSRLFSPEISFAPLKLDLKVKGGRRRSGGMSEVAVFKNTEIRASALSHGWCCLQHGQRERAVLRFASCGRGVSQTVAFLLLGTDQPCFGPKTQNTRRSHLGPTGDQDVAFSSTRRIDKRD